MDHTPQFVSRGDKTIAGVSDGTEAPVALLKRAERQMKMDGQSALKWQAGADTQGS